jgi:hypothetical protein
VNIQLLLAGGFAGVVALLHGGLAEAYARHKNVLRAPQWILCLAIAGFAVWGAATS